MNLYDVIKKPVITEKSMYDLEAGKYTFEVDSRAHKLLIKQAVEAAPKTIKEGIPKDAAEALVAKFKEAGAVAEIK